MCTLLSSSNVDNQGLTRRVQNTFLSVSAAQTKFHVVPYVSRLMAETKDLDSVAAYASEVKGKHPIRHPVLAIPAPKSFMNGMRKSGGSTPPSK